MPLDYPHRKVMQRFDPGIPPAPEERGPNTKPPQISIGQRLVVSLPPAGKILTVLGPIIIDICVLWVTWLATSSGKLDAEILKYVIFTLIGGNLALRVRKQGGGGFVLSVLTSLFGKGA